MLRSTASWVRLWRPLPAMTAVIVASSFLAQFPINDWLTWGAFTYPVAFLVTDLTNRGADPVDARRVAWAGFGLAVALSARGPAAAPLETRRGAPILGAADGRRPVHGHQPSTCAPSRLRSCARGPAGPLALVHSHSEGALAS